MTVSSFSPWRTFAPENRLVSLADRPSTIAPTCQDQTETGEDDAIFVLEDGATLSNVIIGPGQAEGVHCLGTWYALPTPPP